MWFYLIAKTSERCMNNHYKNIKLNPKLKAINSEKAVKKTFTVLQYQDIMPLNAAKQIQTML